MDFVLVFPLILAFLSSGQSYTKVTEQTSNSCYKLCPAGYHKVGDCNDPAAKYKCKKCDNNTYTEIENHIEKCHRCQTCGSLEVVIRPCSFNSDVECDCKEGFYNAGSTITSKLCEKCKCEKCEERSGHPDYERRCQPCQRAECLKYPECKRRCNATTVPPPTTPPSTSVLTKHVTVAASATARATHLSPVIEPISPNTLNYIPWLVLGVVVVIFVLLFWLLLVFTRNHPGKICPCWSMDKGVEPHAEEPNFNDINHQVSSPTTQTLHISEETPMMVLSQSPATPQDSAQICPRLPNAEHKAARQDDQSEHWPAIVLYAIIKEVPLRRWKEFLRLLSVADQQLERVELEAGLGLGSMERQYQMLRLWSQRSSASLDDVFSALHYMDLSGCAQLLQENLEKLQWRSEPKQGFAAC
ncbi:tumor necrosis factor receptor superfamily member 25 [Toxotes jaculatrix]|uniref:tumor necrosis factor receptor superfamily member 25 n=1 Tax=Toxotes jaculatrix TaxID=941984 RepID=UPI001B3AE3B8|nr:tumor necrosis factor receptor superfamily member 25 [Toxotes jaculatrix]